MRGHQQIILDRQRGFKPVSWVFVETAPLPAGDDSHDWARKPLIHAWPGQEPRAFRPTVVLDQHDQPHLTDWRWCLGLMLIVNGTATDRVHATYGAIKAAGAAVVVAIATNETETIAFDSRRGN